MLRCGNEIPAAGGASSIAMHCFSAQGKGARFATRCMSTTTRSQIGGRLRFLNTRMLFAVLAISLAVMTVDTTNSNAQLPAGTTNAVLSYVDAADGHVSVVRHWRGPGTGQDTQVEPFTGYFWDGCLPFQDGALMILVTSPVGYPPPGLTSAETYTTQYLARLGQALSTSVAGSAAQLAQDQSGARQNLQQIASSLTTPGNSAHEAMKAALGQVNSLSAYEDYGYAVFMFIRWKWIYTPFPIAAPCAQVDFRTVPEGYGVPFVN